MTATEASATHRTALVVGSGLVVAGVASYGFLVTAARALGPTAYAPLSAFWALVVLAGPGCFGPLEQELARELVVRRERGDGTAPAVRSVVVIGIALASVLGLAALAAGPFLLDQVLDGDGWLLAAFVAGLFAYAAQHTARGLVAGTGRFGRYAFLAGAEGVVRLGAAAGLLVAGVNRPGPYGIVVVVGTVVAVALSLGGAGRLLTPGSAASHRRTASSLGTLLAAAALAQLLLNAPPLLVKALAGEHEQELAGRFLGALVLARVPLFLFVAVQATLLPSLTQAATRGAWGDFKRSLRTISLLIGAITGVGTVAAATVGPAVVRALLGVGFHLGGRDLGLLVAGTGAYMVAIVLGQALVARHATGLAAVGWAAGVAALVATIPLQPGLLAQAEVGFLVGSLVASLVMAAFVLRPPPNMRRPRSDPGAGG